MKFFFGPGRGGFQQSFGPPAQVLGNLDPIYTNCTTIILILC